jgi:hypothetical protein
MLLINGIGKWLIQSSLALKALPFLGGAQPLKSRFVLS